MHDSSDSTDRGLEDVPFVHYRFRGLRQCLGRRCNKFTGPCSYRSSHLARSPFGASRCSNLRLPDLIRASQTGLAVAVATVVLPLQRLQVFQLISPAIGNRPLVPDFPAKFAVGIPVAPSPNKCAIRIHSERRVFAANRCFAPHGFNDCLIEGLARCICIRMSGHVINRPALWPEAPERFCYCYCPGPPFNSRQYGNASRR